MMMMAMQGFQYQLGDFQLRVGKVTPTHSDSLRGIIMEVMNSIQWFGLHNVLALVVGFVLVLCVYYCFSGIYFVNECLGICCVLDYENLGFMYSV